MAAADQEIRIQGEDFATAFKFRKPDQARIRQRHRPVTIPQHQSAEVRLMFLHLQSNAYDATFQQRKQGIDVAAFSLEKKGRLGENRFASQ